MTDLVSSNVLPLTFLLLALLALRKTLLKHFGAKMCYQLWLLVPLFLAMHYAPSFSFNTYTLQPSVFTVVLSDMPEQVSTYGQTSWIASIWLMGASIIGAYFVLAHRNFHKALNESLDTGKVNEARIEADQSPLFYRSQQVTSPMLTGLIMPKLILPTAFEQKYNQQQQKLIIAHEICHYRRGDIYWNLLATVCLVLFWFHPLAWLAFAKYRQDQELSCDHAVMVDLSLDDKKQYAHALLNTIENHQSAGLLHMSFGKFGDKSTMQERIQQLQSNTKHNKLATIGIFSLAVFLISSTTLAETAVTKASLPTKPTLAQKAEMPEKEELAEKEEQPKNELSPVDVVYPKYPVDAARNEIEGSVTLSFDINHQGHPENITIVESVPEGVFDEQATLAFKQWRYEPQKETIKSNTVQLDFVLGPR